VKSAQLDFKFPLGQTYKKMVVDCAIKIENNPRLIFYAGQTLAGTVEVTVDKPVKVQSKYEAFGLCD
jgi:hypothetical protein